MKMCVLESFRGTQPWFERPRCSHNSRTIKVNTNANNPQLCELMEKMLHRAE